MKYYQVQVSAEPKVIGVSNGVYQLEINNSKLEKNEDFKEFLTFFKSSNREFWKNQFKIKDFKVPVIEGKLLKRAKLTDIMGYAEEIPFLYDVYSEKFISTIEASNLPNHSKFEVAIQDVKEKYYLLFIETIILEDFNFQESMLRTGYEMTKNLEEYRVDNFDEYKELRKSCRCGIRQ